MHDSILGLIIQLLPVKFWCFNFSVRTLFIVSHRELHDGTSLKDNGIMDGSRIILLPNVETGLLVSIHYMRSKNSL